MASLPTGTGWICSGEAQVFQRVAFPRISTYDNSATPKDDDHRHEVASAPVDVERLRTIIGEAVKEAESDDPKALRKTIAELERRLTETGKPVTATDQQLAAEYDRGHNDGYRIALHDMRPHVHRAQEELTRLTKVIANPVGATMPVNPPPAPVKRADLTPRVQPASSGTNGAFPRAERLVLTALAQYPQGRTKVQVAILTGYAVNGGGFSNSISSLRTKGYLEGDAHRLVITPGGIAALGTYDPLPEGRALLQHWLGQLGRAERKALEALAEVYPRTLSKAQLANRAGYEPNGGGWNNALGKLRTLELISGRAELKASDALFG